MTRPSDAAHFLITEATAALGRLRTAWPWLAEARIPGPEGPTVQPPDRREYLARVQAEAAVRDRRAKVAALSGGTTPDRSTNLAARGHPSVPPGPHADAARVGPVAARHDIASNVRRLTERLWAYTTGRDGVYGVADPASRTPGTRCVVCSALGGCDCDHADAVMAGCLRLLPDLLRQVHHPEQAADAVRTLDRADREARRAARAGEHRIHIKAPCPVCGSRDLWAETSSPRREEWTVRCESPLCTCRGPSCPCARPVRWRGRRHLWPSPEWGVRGGLADKLGAVPMEPLSPPVSR